MARQTASPLWAEAPSRFKRNFDPQFDQTGMRAAANTFSDALSPLMGINAFEGDGGVQVARMMSFDPYGGQIIGNGKSKTYNEFNKDPAAWLANRRRQIEAMPETTTTFDLDAGNVVQQTDRARKLAELEAAEKAFGEYQTKFGDWKSKYTNETLDRQLDQALGLNAPNLESDVSARNRLNANLMRYGITDLNQVGSEIGPDGKPVFFNKATGEQLPDQIGHFKSNKHGTLRVGFNPVAGGGIRLGERFEGPKAQFDDYMGRAVLATLLAVGGGALGGAATSALGSAGMGSTAASVGGQALGQGLSGGLGSAMQGGDFGQGFMTGAVGGGIGGGIGAWNPGGQMFTNPTYAGIANRAIGGGLAGGANAAMRGQNAGDAFMRGVISSGMTGGLTQAGIGAGFDPRIASQLGGLGSRFAMNQFYQPRRRG